MDAGVNRSIATDFSVHRLTGFEALHLLIARAGLMVAFPVRDTHPVDVLLGGGVVEVRVCLFGSSGIPLGQAVTTKSGESHQVDILHIAARLQMGYQGTKCRGFCQGLLIFGHGLSLNYNELRFLTKNFHAGNRYK